MNPRLRTVFLCCEMMGVTKRWNWVYQPLDGVIIEISLPMDFLRPIFYCNKIFENEKKKLEDHPQQLNSLCVWKDVKVLRRECKMQNYISFLKVLIIFENFQNFSFGIIISLSKMSLQGTIGPGRLRSDLCPWGVKNHSWFLSSK